MKQWFMEHTYLKVIVLLLSLGLLVTMTSMMRSCAGPGNEEDTKVTTNATTEGTVSQTENHETQAPSTETTVPEEVTEPTETTVPEETDPGNEGGDGQTGTEPGTETTPKETDPIETTVPEETEPKTGAHFHEYKETVVKATCTNGGYTLHACSCGADYKDNITEALGHDYTSMTISPTTGSSGYDLHTCSRCGDRYKDNYTDPLPEPTDPKETDPTEPEETEPTNPDETRDPGSAGGEGSGNQGGGTPETEDYGFCPRCGRRYWTTWYPEGCITAIKDTICFCGQLVHAWECHHHEVS